MFLIVFFQARQFCANLSSNLNFVKSSLINQVLVLHGLHFPLWLSTTINLQLLAGFSLSILSIWCKSFIILAIPKLFCNSSNDFLSLRLTWYIHCTICMHVRAILLMSLFFSRQVLLLYSMTLMTLMTQAEYNFPYVFFWKYLKCNNRENLPKSISDLT